MPFQGFPAIMTAGFRGGVTPPVVPVLVQGTCSNGAMTDGNTLAFNGNVVAGNAILVLMRHTYLGCPPTVTDSQGNTYTSKGSQPQVAGFGYFWIFTAVAGSSAALTITVHMACGSADTVYLLEVSGLASNPYDVQNVHSNSTSPVTTGAFTPSQSGCYIIGWFTRATVASTLTAGSGFVAELVENAFTIDVGALEDLVQSSAASINPDMTTADVSAGFPIAGFGVAFKGA